VVACWLWSCELVFPGYCLGLDFSALRVVDYRTHHLISLSVVTEIILQSKVVGFKTARIVEDPIPGQEGLTFYIEINGVPIFAKGTLLTTPLCAFRGY